MRPLFVTSCLFLAVIVSTILFWIRHKDDHTRFDQIVQTMSGLKSILPPGGNILIKNNSGYWEADMQVMSALAPVQIYQVVTGEPDSILYVLDYSTGNNSFPAPDSNHSIIWHGQDEQLQYVFMVKK